MRISLGTDSILWSLQAESFTQRQTSGKVDLDLDVVDTLRDFILHFMIKRNLENVEVFTYLCRPPLQGTDAALQASQVSLSQSTPELSRTTNFQTGFASCDVPQPPKSVLWSRCCTLSVWSLMALCFQTSQAGPVCCCRNILLRFYYLHCYCYAGPARLNPNSAF